MMLKEMGFAFAFSILIDALVVRTYLVPAVMSTFGKWNWYNPIKRLQRIKDLDDNKQPQSNQRPKKKLNKQLGNQRVPQQSFYNSFYPFRKTLLNNLLV